MPDYDPDLLPSRAADGVANDFVDEHTKLPRECGPDESPADDGCWPVRVNELVREVTAGASDDYERVRMLQDYFTDPANFAYDINVARGRGLDINDFLFEARAGYSEQFAAAFAAMARSLDIPTRVAVGFTWGEWDESRRVYVVRGEHAHAWPEVYFAGAGWIAVESTPDRNGPHDADLTS